jgi:glycosyltransferase involved in cell wall biosynthesis
MAYTLVSVIIPTYNRASLVGRAVDNVLEQTYKNTEIIVVDDGSTDDTQSTLRRFGDRIRLITQANRGPAAARNRGTEIAKGEIIAFQDSDDLWLPTKLERQVALLDRAGPSVPCCLCNAQMYFKGKAPTTSFDLAPIRPTVDEGIWSNVADVLVTTFILFNQCAAIRADVLRRLGGYNESLRLMEDYDLALRLALEGNAWAFIKDELVIWRQGAPGSLWQRAKNDEVVMRECALRCLEVFNEKVEATEQLARLKKISRQELERRRREVTIARMGKLDIVGASMSSWILEKVEKYRRVIHRMTRRYPAMAVRILQT